MVLDKIKQPNDIKKLTDQELSVLPGEIREFLIDHLSKTGGHLASNLGTVELTMALHLLLDFPKDKLVWDVGHQAYTHKILTGRAAEFDNLRQYGGISGFPKRKESDCDSFDTGHSSTSLSAALGYCMARDLAGEDYKVCAVIGDGALTGGLAYEALNNASRLNKSNMLIILNDNEMSISKNVGGMSTNLERLRTSSKYVGLKNSVMSSLESWPNGENIIRKIRSTKNGIKSLMVPNMVFEDLGIMYLGPVDGHNIKAMVETFEMAVRIKGPVLVHVITKKGNGYEPAERHPSRFHGTDIFEIETGLPKRSSNPGYTDVFSTVMRKMGDRNPEVVAITAAMAEGAGLKRFRNMFPERFFDVGIAEEHAVTFAAGLALGGRTPVFAVYSSFLQRAYDQILEDVCLQNLHVVFAIDRAGLVGADGSTHQGVFDVSFLTAMPNMTVMAPKNKWELSDMMKFAVGEFNGPIAIRYPRGEAYCGLKEHRAPIQLGKAEEIKPGSKVMLFALGSMVKKAEEVEELLKEKGIDAGICNARFAKPFDTEYLDRIKSQYDLIVTMEENVKTGGFGQQVQSYLYEQGYKGKVLNIAVPDEFVQHGSVTLLFKELKMDAPTVAERILESLGN
ncbi:1-deoxy-D-xylulose-5-phosphate synthase [Pseudobutyrivibrio xylanivorans]|uniref:1-deoxy-D-xylulose-5-phosphate synthase n=1 Tax=Pseudobutyrivibrio xylanivorans TaxID=185007 RepID=A0A5P6VW92_PSEXY|nr:1-deoxy-D-xylulose-5-phosphate synthase [Pseudobutyrivibrio xylanivorans]QFJ56261.1 1-deoxy-D-xylulose-5-phosphate synthase [Pseudobutyrivibrio xylanivorans]